VNDYLKIESAKEIVRMVFYGAEAWQKLNAIAPVEMSHSDYLRIFDKTTRAYEAHGIKTEKATIDIDAMIAWCRSNDCEIDDKARTAYCNFELRARDIVL
jgi:hypothetical protein